MIILSAREMSSFIAEYNELVKQVFRVTKIDTSRVDEATVMTLRNRVLAAYEKYNASDFRKYIPRGIGFGMMLDMLDVEFMGVLY